MDRFTFCSAEIESACIAEFALGLPEIKINIIIII